MIAGRRIGGGWGRGGSRRAVGESALVQVAASSRASGRPSSRRQMATMAGAVSAVSGSSAPLARPARRRAGRRCIRPDRPVRPPDRQAAAQRRHGARTRRRGAGGAAGRQDHQAGAGPEQFGDDRRGRDLLTIVQQQQRRGFAQQVLIRSRIGRAPPSCNPRARAMAAGTKSGSAIGARSTKTGATCRAMARSRAIWSESRVLPTPPARSGSPAGRRRARRPPARGAASRPVRPTARGSGRLAGATGAAAVPTAERSRNRSRSKDDERARASVRSVALWNDVRCFRSRRSPPRRRRRGTPEGTRPRIGPCS